MFAIIITSEKIGATREGQKFVLRQGSYGLNLDFYDGGMLPGHSLIFNSEEKATEIARQVLQAKKRFHQCKAMLVEVVRWGLYRDWETLDKLKRKLEGANDES